MDRRTKILLAAFAVLVGGALIRGVVYPAWIQPLLTIDERIAERQKVLDVLEAREAAVQEARHEYKALVARVGSFEVGRVETDVRDRLNQLIEKHHLQDAAVSPSRPVEDRKTGLWATSISVSANGTLESTIGFLKDLTELPHLTRVGNPSLSPVSGGRKDSKKEIVSLRVPVDLLILPRHRLVGTIKDAELIQPDSHVRHQGREYGMIWDRKPFSEYVPPIPLRATVARSFNVLKGQPVVLDGGATGGDGEYTYSWSPTEGLNDPTSMRPTVDTSTPATTTYTLTVTDGSSNLAVAATTVTVREPPPPPPPAVVQQEKPTPPPPPPGPKRWPDARNMTIIMALLQTMGTDKLDEFMVYNKISRQTNYYKIGDEFDGGELVFVHQRGGVVRRNEDYFVYPIGVNLDQHVAATAAEEFPELKLVADKLREVRKEQKKPGPSPADEPEGPLKPAEDQSMEGPPADSPDGGDREVKPMESDTAKKAEPAKPDEKPERPNRRTNRPMIPKRKP